MDQTAATTVTVYDWVVAISAKCVKACI